MHEAKGFPTPKGFWWKRSWGDASSTLSQSEIVTGPEYTYMSGGSRTVVDYILLDMGSG